MLQDYITQYVDAYLVRDKMTMRKIEGNLCKLGMDRATLIYLLKVELTERKQKNGN